MTITKKHKQMLVIALVVALLAGMFVPISPTYAVTGEEELILEGESGEVNMTGDPVPENSQLLFAATAMAVDTSVQLDTQSKIYYDNWFTSRYRVKVNGEWKVCYCVQPDLYAPPDGSYTPAYGTDVEYDVAKGLYYSYGYPGWTKTTKPVVKKLLSQYGDKDWNLSSSDDCYSLCHILLSYYYDDVSANSADAFMGVDKDTRQIIRALANQIKNDTETFPDIPRTAETCEVSFTADGKSGDGITIELEKDDWNSSKAIQTTPTIKLKGYRDNSVNITVPAGVTMHMTVDGEKETYAAGTTVEVFVGDPFYFTAPDTKTGTWSSGTLKASIAEFTAYMIKVSGKQNMAFAGVDNADITSLKIDWLDEGEGELYKSGKNTVIIKDNDNYSLAGGVFEVYDADGDLYGSMTTDEKGYANIKNIPYGTYTVKEKKAPKGYAKTDEVATLKITTPAAVAVDFANLPQNDILDIVVVKEDSETEKKLKDAIFEINFHAIDYMPGKAEIKRLEPQKTWTVVTDAEGVAKLKAEYLAEGYESDSFFKDSRGNICLPLGLVTVQEIKAPEGYLIHDELFVQRITSEGTLETVDVYNEHDVYDHIKRGDFEFIKVSEDNMKRMAGVPFKVTALDGQYKGESHIIVTDANGYYTSSAERNEHSGKTNANDAAYDEKNVDESKLDAASGLWFGPDDAVTDHRGALPYGRYRLDELRCEANMGHQLLKGVEFVISMDEVTVDLGTMMDKQILIGTQASDADTGKQMSYARDNYTLKDTVQLEGFERGETYTLKGVLMDKQTQQPLKASGKDVTSEVTFTAKAKEQSVEVEFTFDARNLEGKEVVVFESLYEGEFKVAIHEDIEDEGQTILFRRPLIDTIALGKDTGIHEMLAGDKVTLRDAIRLENLIPGEKITVTGSLVDKETGEPVIDALGNAITEKVTFTPDEEDEKVYMDFTFDSKGFEGKSVVVMQSVSWKDNEVVSHKNLEDADQTIVFPEIGTTAADTETCIQNSFADEQVTIRDTVSFKNLIKDHTYTVVGTIMDKETGAPLMVDDQEITVEKEFRAESETGTVEMEFTFDASALKGKTVIVFEDMYYEGKLIAVHADIEDEGQTLWFPEIGTTAADSETGSHNSNADNQVTIKDIVSFENLIKGETYKVSGKLMDQETGQPLLVSGAEVTSEKEFVAEEAAGTVELEFTFDGSALAGKAVVVFEDVYYQDKLVAVHADITDEGQTIWMPEIGTTAADKADGDKEITSDGKVTIVDKVSYKGLEIGQKFVAKGKLIDKATGKPLLVDGKEVTAEKTFAAKEANGTVEVKFTFDATGLGDKELVVFEKFFHAESGIEVAQHEDVTDEGQTVKFVTPPSVPQTGDDSAIGFLIALATVAAAAALYTGFWRRKKKNDHSDE